MKNVTVSDREFELILNAVSFMRKFTSAEADLVCELDLSENAHVKIDEMKRELDDLGLKLSGI